MGSSTFGTFEFLHLTADGRSRHKTPLPACLPGFAGTDFSQPDLFERFLPLIWNSPLPSFAWRDMLSKWISPTATRSNKHCLYSGRDSRPSSRWRRMGSSSLTTMDESACSMPPRNACSAARNRTRLAPISNASFLRVSMHDTERAWTTGVRPTLRFAMSGCGPSGGASEPPVRSFRARCRSLSVALAERKS